MILVRVINTDSAFASVTTAEACRKYVLHFTGLVTTATTKFPMKYFNDLEYNEPGDHVLTASINGHSLVAGLIQLGNTSYPHTTQH